MTPGSASDAPRRGNRRLRRIPLFRLIDFVKRLGERIGADNLNVVAAGVAFYGLLALFPFLAALISVFGLIADPSRIRDQMQTLHGTVPPQAYEIIDAQVQQLTREEATLSISLVVSTTVALYSSTRGVKAIMGALNIVYDVGESRNIIKQNLVALGLTAGTIVSMVVALMLVVVLPLVFTAVGVEGNLAADLILAGRWLLMLAGVLFGLGVIYHIAPNRPRARFRLLSWGTVVGAALWLAASMLFSWYVTNFASYNETYGSLGAVVVLLMWFFVGAYAVLIGAEIDAEVEDGRRRRESLPPGHRHRH